MHTAPGSLLIVDEDRHNRRRKTTSSTSVSVIPLWLFLPLLVGLHLVVDTALRKMHNAHDAGLSVRRTREAGTTPVQP